MNAFIRLLLIVGLVTRRRDGTIAWPFNGPPRHAFKDWRTFVSYARFCGSFYVFRNLPGVVKRIPGRILPRRWGFGIFGFEFGDRGH